LYAVCLRRLNHYGHYARQESGWREARRAILDADIAKDPVAFNTHVVLGQSATHQISHTKGGVIDGRVGFEGSTNWSASGEGTFVVKGRPGGLRYKAQNNTLAVFTDADTIARFTGELVAEHGPGEDSGPFENPPFVEGQPRRGPSIRVALRPACPTGFVGSWGSVPGSLPTREARTRPATAFRARSPTGRAS
jgi:hypothetical protein